MTKLDKKQESENLLKKGIRYLAISLPLLFFSPILITIGFKALKKDDNYIVLILGCCLAFFTIGFVIQAFRHLLKSFFDR